MLQKRHLSARLTSSSSSLGGSVRSAPDWGPGKGTRAMTGRSATYALWSTVAHRHGAGCVDPRQRRRRRGRGRSGRRPSTARELARCSSRRISSSSVLLQLVRGPLELGEALAERTAQFGQLSGAENDQSDHENDDQLWHADGTKHGAPAFRRTGGRPAQLIIGTGLARGQEIPTAACARSRCL